MACRTFGGDGCTANCTAETTQVTVPVALRSATGLTEPPPFLVQATGFLSPAGLHAARVPVALRSTQTFILGKPRAGNIPVAVPAASIDSQPTPISVLACACVRNPEFQTCGGTLFDEHGSPSVACTAGFAAPADCAAVGLPPCTAVHGPANAASGFVSCDGLRPLDLFVWQDSNTAGAGENGRPQRTFRHSAGGPGSVLLACVRAVGVQAGGCEAFCTADSNPTATRGVPSAFLFTTGQACSQVIHWDEAHQSGTELCAQGKPVACSAWSDGQLTGLPLVSTSPSAAEALELETTVLLEVE